MLLCHNPLDPAIEMPIIEEYVATGRELLRECDDSIAQLQVDVDRQSTAAEEKLKLLQKKKKDLDVEIKRLEIELSQVPELGFFRRRRDPEKTAAIMVSISETEAKLRALDSQFAETGERSPEQRDWTLARQLQHRIRPRVTYYGDALAAHRLMLSTHDLKPGEERILSNNTNGESLWHGLRFAGLFVLSHPKREFFLEFQINGRKIEYRLEQQEFNENRGERIEAIKGVLRLTGATSSDMEALSVFLKTRGEFFRDVRVSEQNKFISMWVKAPQTPDLEDSAASAMTALLNSGDVVLKVRYPLLVK